MLHADINIEHTVIDFLFGRALEILFKIAGFPFEHFVVF